MTEFRSPPIPFRLSKIFSLISRLFNYGLYIICFLVFLIIFYIENVFHKSSIFVLSSWIISFFFLLGYFYILQRIITSFKAKNNLLVHPTAWLSQTSPELTPKEGFFLLPSGKEFFISKTRFSFQNNPLTRKKIFSLFTPAVICLDFLILSFEIPHFTPDLASYNPFFVFVFFSIFLLIAITFYTPFFLNSPFTPDSQPFFFWQFSKIPPTQISFQHIPSSKQIILFDNSTYDPDWFNCSTIKIKDLYPSKKILKFLHGSKTISVLSFNIQNKSVDNQYILFTNLSLSNVELIKTCFEKWFFF